jgi:putative ABC transport system permease protein
MWVHYWRTASRALLADRFFSFVNLLGLSVGLAAVAIIFFYVAHEYSYDRWLPRHESLYRIDTVETSPGQQPVEIATAPGPLKAVMVKDFPQVAAISRAYATRSSVVRGGQPFGESVLAADPDFLSLLGLRFAAGQPEQALRTSRTVALSARAAEKYFAAEDPVGRRLTILVPEPRDFVVGSVFETLPGNSHMAFDVVIPFDGYFGANSEEVRAIPDAWGGAYFHTYVRLKDGASAAGVEKGLPALVDRSLPAWLTALLSGPPHEFYRFRLVPVRDIHFEGAATGAMKPGASREGVLAVAAVALLILFIASINFANLTSARSTLRAREVALRKVVGAKRRQIAAQFLVEAAVLTLAAGLVALAMVELSLPYLGQLFGLPSAFIAAGDWRLWAAILALVLVTAALSGIYPSLVVSRIRPALVLGRGSAARSGGALRTALVVVQFAVSIGLIATTAAMMLQTRYAASAELGFKRDNLLVLRLPEGPEQAALARSFAEALTRNPEVAAVALSSAVPSDVSENNISIRTASEAKPISLGFHRVDSSFFETYGVEPLSGRTSSMQQRVDATDGSDGQPLPVVVNRTAFERLGFSRSQEALGEVVRASDTAYTIIGVVPDLHFRSLHQPVREEMYLLDDAPGGVISVRYRTGDVTSLLAQVDRLWRERLPERPVDRIFLGDAIDALYARERTQAVLLGIFSGLAILLSCLGLLAMAAFSLQRRIREIALRKVLGARTRDVARLLLWDISKPVLLANLVAWPVAWLVLRDWLNGFAYRIELPLAVFPLAGGGALLIACAAVAAHALKAARSHPALALRHE